MAETKPKSMKTGAVVVGSEMVGFALVGVLIDYLIGTLNTVPWATLILAPLGLLVGMVHLVRFAKSEQKP
jgi:F0F1-type ATP synthase assembly protein I